MTSQDVINDKAEKFDTINAVLKYGLKDAKGEIQKDLRLGYNVYFGLYFIGIKDIYPLSEKDVSWSVFRYV